jgi:DNA-binding NarL/FixJ family response regulator
MAVLIFEKSAEVTNRLIELVKEGRTGVKIYTADSFTSAVNLLEQKKLEVVLLDLNFGGDFSLELLQLIKKVNSKIVVIVLYNYADEKRLQQCQTHSADFVFDKYNDFEKIPGIISTVCKQNKNTINTKDPDNYST